MSEILFRGINRVTGEWIQGDLFHHGEQAFIAVDNRVAEIDSKTIGRYAGITDKDDKRVFEGDIIRLSSFDGLKVNTFTFVVKFGPYQDSDSHSNDIAIGFYLEKLDNRKHFHIIKDTDDVVEIIGNIHNIHNVFKLWR